MSNSTALDKFLVLVRDEDTYYKYAKVDWLDEGQGLFLYDYHIGEKLSRHSNGNVYRRPAGAGQHVPPTTAVPFSDITHEVVKQVPIPSNVSVGLEQCSRATPSNAFVFSSTALQSNATFAAELVDDSLLSNVLQAWQNHPDYVSAQTCRANNLGKNVVLTVLSSRST
jgi:hypothetical protein